MGTESTWRSLARSLGRDDISSPYLERIRDTINAKGKAGLQSVQREIVEEMAYALNKAERKVNEALLECDLLALLWLDTAGVDRDEHADEFDAARARARRAKWEYMVHREALGLLWTDEIDREFPIPGSIDRYVKVLQAREESGDALR